jgi:hypothetical protein
MAESVTSFNEYVEEGGKLSNFQEMYSTLESFGKGMTNVKGVLNSAANLEFLDTLRDKFSAATSVNDKITDGLKKLGLTDKSISLLNRATGGLLSSADPFIMSLYGAAETFASSILEDFVSAILANVYVPEDVFLLGVKGLAGAKSDPNLRNVLRSATLRHDLAKTLEWLDNYNKTTYDIDSILTNDAITASKNGCFKVAEYIMKKLKETYNEIKACVAITESDEEYKSLELIRYEHFFNNVIRHIFVYSYSNLLLSDFRSIINNFPTFTPSCLGTSDDEYTKRALITSSEIDAMAPFRRYKTLETIINENAPDKVFIVPRNKHIKTIYIWLAFSTDYNSNKLLVHKELHDRLKHKMLSTLEEAFYEAQKSLLGSPLSRFITGAKNNYLSLLAEYVEETDPYLFDPKKQTNLIEEDKIILPNFRSNETSDNANISLIKSVEKELPVPPIMENSGLSYDNFMVYYVDPVFTNEQVTRDSIAIVLNKKLYYVISKSLERHSLDISIPDIIIDTFFIFYNDKLSSNLSQEELDKLFLYILAKYIIDIYTAKGYTNESGILSQFYNYYNELFNKLSLLGKIDGEGTNSSPGLLPNNSGMNRLIEDISFYTEVLDNDGNLVKIDPTGVNTYNTYGEKISSFHNNPANSIGIDIIDNDTYLLAVSPKTSEKEAYYSPDKGLTWEKMNVDASDASIYPGVGITSLKQLNFYEVIYYDNTFFKINGHTIAYSSDRINWENMDIYLNEIILGICILPSGTLYILTELYIYEIPNFSINSTNADMKVVAENDYNYTIIKGIIGTILNGSSIPYNTLDDFDIDDKITINKILAHYQSARLIYYWYSTESPITADVLQKNIEFLQGQYDNTDDPLLRSIIEQKIAKQNEYITRIS